MYRWVDAQGVVHYSDTPQPGAQQLALPGAQTYHSTPAPASAPISTPTPTVGDQPYQSCAIAQPGAAQTLFSPDQVRVTVALSPGLRAGDSLSVSMDGAALPPMIDGGADFQITDIDRGTHTITAMVRNSNGKTLCTATPVTFTVQRPSIANPQAPNRAH